MNWNKARRIIWCKKWIVWTDLKENVLQKQPIMIAIAMVMHYFHPGLEQGLPPSLNLNHNAYWIFPRILVRRESMARGTLEHFTFARA